MIKKILYIILAVISVVVITILIDELNLPSSLSILFSFIIGYLLSDKIY